VGRLGKTPVTSVSTLFKGQLITVGGFTNQGASSVVGGPLGSRYENLTSITSGLLNDLDDNGEVLVASGQKAYATRDGRNWQNVGVQLRCVTWDGTRFIGVTDNVVIYASTDGFTWTQIGNVSTSDRPRDIIYAEGRYVMVSEGSTQTKIRHSIDAVTWTNATRINDVTINSTQLRTVAHNGSTFVATRRGEAVFTSDDGITWTRQAASAEPSPNSGTFVYIGDDIDNFGTQFVTSTHSSPDGINWTLINGGRGNGFGEGATITPVGNRLIITDQDGVTILEK
jgi:hypothetical protein